MDKGGGSTSLSQRFIRKLGDPILRITCSPVENTVDVRQLLDDMLAVLRATPNGVAVAAPQIGSTKRIISIAMGDHIIELINPEIIKKHGHQKGPESCLSLPGVYGIVPRSRYITVKAFDRAGEELTLEAKGFLARCLQHEIDHLNGILYIDHVLPSQLFDEFTKQPLDIINLINISNQHSAKEP